MTNRKQSKCSEKSYNMRKLILSLIDKPMRRIDIVQALEKALRRVERLSKGDLNNHLTMLVNAGCLHVEYRKLIAADRYWYTVTDVEYNPDILSGSWVGRFEERKKKEEELWKSTQAAASALKEKEAKDGFLKGSAMRNVANLAEKLKAQQRLLNADRNRQIRSNLGGCAGVSGIYEG